MTEEQIRQIVRDELEAECIRENGIYDKTRFAAFNMVRSSFEIYAKNILKSFEPRDGDK